jgi:hypothetical protein
MPWYKEWTGKEASAIKDNVDHVFKELTGKIDYDRIGRLPVSPLAWPAISEPVGFAAGNRGN